MGPNGSGKSTLANALLGSPDYRVTAGSIRFQGEDITALPADERAARGIFLGFQHPEEIPGVNVLNFLRQALAVRKGIPDLSVLEVRMAPDGVDQAPRDGRPLHRAVPERRVLGRREEAQRDPADGDDGARPRDPRRDRLRPRHRRAPRSWRTASPRCARARPELGILLITHYQRILEHLTPDVVHILLDGRVVATGGPELAERVEAEGFDSFRKEVAA